MAIDYLTLVNVTIDESGVDLDPLTADNFMFPPKTKMYDRFKRWVNRAWREIQTDHLDFGLTQSRSVAYLFPRITVRGVSGAFNNGDILYDSLGDEIGEIYQILSRPDGLYSIDLYTSLETPTIGERLETAGGSFCFYVYVGEYDIRLLAPDIVDINRTEVTVGIGADGGDNKLIYVPWSSVNSNSYQVNGANVSLPGIYTINSQHMIEFLPAINSPIYIGFSYSKESYALVNSYDVLKDFPDRFALGVVWRAVMSYADYERDSALYMRANKQYHRIMVYADISLGEQISMGGWNV